MYLGGNRPLGAREKPHSHQLLIPFNIISILHFSSILNFGIKKMYNFIAHINQEVDHVSKQK